MLNYIGIIILIITLGILLYIILMTLKNKLHNPLVEITLNKNIIRLLNYKRYTKETLNFIKFLLITRLLFFAAGLTFIILSNSPIVTSMIVIVLLVINNLVYMQIETKLGKDFDNWCEENE